MDIKKDALIVIDFQNDFCEGGSRAADGTLEMIPLLNRVSQYFGTIIFTMDWHPHNHMSFRTFGGEFPEHCIQGENGAKLNSAIIVKDNDCIIKKGFLQKYDSYSAFYNANYIYQQSRLDAILRTRNIEEIYICGIDFENTIFSTLLDGIRFNYKCVVIEDIISYADQHKLKIGKEYLETLGVKFISSTEIIEQKK